MNKKFLLLLGAYASWVATALYYNRKTPKDIEAELETAKKSGEKDIKVLFNNFLEIHKNLLEDLKVRLLTEENKELFHKKRGEFLALVDDYKIKASEIAKEYKEKWYEYAEEWLKKLDKFYKEKLDELDDLKDEAPEKIEDAKKKLLTYYNEFRAKLRK